MELDPSNLINMFQLSLSPFAQKAVESFAGTKPKDFKRNFSNTFHGQGLNPDHCFVATANESGEQDAREKEMEENMNEVGTIKIIITSKMFWMTVIPLKVSATIVNLRNMANDIGNVTKAQNEMLNR